MTEATGHLAISSACSEIWFRVVPEPVRFMTSAGLGNIAFFGIDQVLYKSVVAPLAKDAPKFYQRNKETISFFFAYLIQVGFQHLLNALFVYGIDTISTAEKYFDTLLLTYSSYSVALVGSTVGNALLMKQGISKNVAFWSTIFGFGILNFFLLRSLISTKSANEDAQEQLVVQEAKSAPAVERVPFKRFRGGAQDIWSDFSYGSLFERLLARNDFMLQRVKEMGPRVTYIEK
mmetsp:Transcript_19618/g.28964  ORF Transcript_19618/g.28964 Transcript_19618/m.28964 type:complete len:233 (-) Transcript_19618:13-711(-)